MNILGAAAQALHVTKPIRNSPLGLPVKELQKQTATGADALVTACPWCEDNFVNAVDEDGNKIKVLDIIELVQQAI